MIDMQKANVSFQTAVQVRNRFGCGVSGNDEYAGLTTFPAREPLARGSGTRCAVPRCRDMAFLLPVNLLRP